MLNPQQKIFQFPPAKLFSVNSFEITGGFARSYGNGDFFSNELSARFVAPFGGK